MLTGSIVHIDQRLMERGLNFRSWVISQPNVVGFCSNMGYFVAAVRVTVGYSDTFADPRGCHCNCRPLYLFMVTQNHFVIPATVLEKFRFQRVSLEPLSTVIPFMILVA